MREIGVCIQSQRCQYIVTFYGALFIEVSNLIAGYSFCVLSKFDYFSLYVYDNVFSENSTYTCILYI